MTTLQRIAPVVEVERVSDGDSFWLRVDLGLHERPLKEFRLLGWDTPETQSRNGVTVTQFERNAAQQARVLTHSWLTARVTSPTWVVYVRTLKDPEKWGRWLCQVWAEHAFNGRVDYLGDDLYAAELAAPAPLKWRDLFDPAVTSE